MRVRHRPRLLSDKGPCYISNELKEYLSTRQVKHTRGKRYHPQTQGKIERNRRIICSIFGCHPAINCLLSTSLLNIEHSHYNWTRFRVAGQILGGLFLSGSINSKIIKAYRKHLYGKKTLQDLPDELRFVINATNVQSGALWRFMKPYMRDWRVGEVKSPNHVTQRLNLNARGRYRRNMP